MRVAHLPYLNAWPYRAAWPGDAPCFYGAPPRRLGELAARGELDAAPLASRDALTLEADLRPLPYGVACDGAVMSVLLFSKVPPRDLGGRRVALSGESRTSRGLLRLLLAQLWDVDGVIFVEDEWPTKEPADARLVIGDAALTLAYGRALTPTLWPHVLDLGAAWREWTGLPFVYARWVVRRDLPSALVTQLLNDLDHALRCHASGHGVHVPPRELPTGISSALAQTYLRRLTYRLGPREEAGYERFHLELERHDLLDHHSRPCEKRRAA